MSKLRSKNWFLILTLALSLTVMYGCKDDATTPDADAPADTSAATKDAADKAADTAADVADTAADVKKDVKKEAEAHDDSAGN